MAAIVWTLYRIVLREMAFRYDIQQKGQGEAYIFTYKIDAHSFISVSKLRSGFTWWDYFALPHHAN